VMIEPNALPLLLALETNDIDMIAVSPSELWIWGVRALSLLQHMVSIQYARKNGIVYMATEVYVQVSRFPTQKRTKLTHGDDMKFRVEQHKWHPNQKRHENLGVRKRIEQHLPMHSFCLCYIHNHQGNLVDRHEQASCNNPQDQLL
jgi:hypothetical protein